MISRLIFMYESFSKVFPYILGLTVSVSYQNELAKLIITPISMLFGALLIHYFKPVVLRWVSKLKKN